MVPKLHAKGTSFKGAAAYLLHDKGRVQTSERVSWVETRNLITDDPDMAWRIMAATAMDQDRLKTMAGVKSTGRKSKDSVLHLSLAWHPSEKDGLTREEMLRSANAAIRALEADDRQAMIICHTDEKQPHIHILINRISAKDGRMLSSSKEKLNLSRWAEKYEKERGQVFCEERVLNNEARDRGQHTRGKKDQARHIYEQAPANDNTPRVQQIKAEQKKKDASVAKQARETKERHRRQWQNLRAGLRQRNAGIKAQAILDTAKAKEAVRARFRPDYHQLMHEHQAEQVHFLNNEKSLVGRVSNALRAIDFKSLIGGRSIEPERRGALGQVFDALSSAGARLEKLKTRQAKEKGALEARERSAEKKAARDVRDKRDAGLAESHDQFAKERNDLILSQKLEGAKHRTDWKTRNEQRAKAWETAPVAGGGRAVSPERMAELAERMRQIDQYRERMASKDRDADKDRGPDRDD